MEHIEERPGPSGTGPLNSAFAGGRNAYQYNGDGLFRQRSAAHELERARTALAYIDPHDQDTWLRVGMSLKAEFSDDAWAIFDEWSRPAENYNQRANRTRWRSFKPGGGITIASLFAIARDAGWRDDGTYRLPDPEEMARRRQERVNADAEAKAKRDAGAAEAARKAQEIWSMAAPATAANPYCRRKGIVPCETLREIEVAEAAVVIGYVPSAKGAPLEGRLLLVRIEVRGKLSSLQLIDGMGRKTFLAGGVISRGHWAAQPLPDGDGADSVLLIGEGAATSLSARQAVPGALGLSAMSNTNVPAVALQMRERYPDADIVILADLDKQSGQPDRHAVQAAEACQGRLAVPRFDGGSAPDRKDANDLARLHGPEAVRQMIEAAQKSRGETTNPTQDGAAAAVGAGLGPDMSIIKRTVAPAPSLNLEAFGPLAPWIEQSAETKSAPVDYVAMALLGGAAAVIGTSRWVSPWDGWSEPSILWSMLVGSPSANKSPGMDSVREALGTVETHAAESWPETRRAHETQKAVAEAQRDKWKSEVSASVKAGKNEPRMPTEAEDPPEPQRPRIMVSDATIEAVAVILNGNPRGLVLWRDECSAWLGNLGKYGEGDRAFWIEAYGGRPYTVDRRKLAEPLVIPHMAISFVGGIQPDRLATLLMMGDDDGLAARFLYSWPESLPPRRPRHRPDSALPARALRRLYRLASQADSECGAMQPVTLAVESPAADEFQAWREEHHERSRSATGLMASALGKQPGQALRLAIVLEHLWWAAGPDGKAAPDQVSARALGAALDLIDDYFKPMLERVLGEAAQPLADRHATSLAREILKRRALRLNAREVRREWRLPGMREAASVNSAILALQEARWLNEVGGRVGGTSGRQRGDFVVDPRVHEDGR